jgi:hypothetical protein
MPKYVVTQRVSHGVPRIKDGEAVHDPRTGFAVVDTKTYEPGDAIELTEEEASKISFALEDAPQEKVEGLNTDDPKVAEALDSVRRRPDHPESGVTATWKVDAVTAAELKEDSDEAAKANAEAAVPESPTESKRSRSDSKGKGENQPKS